MNLHTLVPGIDPKPGFRHLMALIFCMSIGFSGISGQDFSELTVPETENSFPGLWSSANDGYLYGAGVNQRTIIYRKRENGQSIEARGSVTSVNPSYRIENRIYSTSTPGLIFVLVRNEIFNYFLLKSSDGGLTFREVFTFGEGNGPDGTNAQDVRLLRGLLELKTELPGGGGTGTLYIGEYNVNRTRIPGGVNDRVRIMKSVDHGDTWTKVVEWNSNGSNQAGHVHAMKQDPYTGEIYVCIGDFNTRIGIIKWDGVSPWADNRSHSQTGSMRGFRVFTGLQRYRTCDVLFDENYFYTFADTQLPNNTGGTESGIWRGRKDFSSYTRVDNQIFSYDPMHIGWFGEKIGNTFIFTTAREYISPDYAWKELNTQVYVSMNGSDWFRTGLLNWRDSGDPTENRYITNVFSYNDKMYIDCTAGAGHSATISLSLTRSWKSWEDPVILHPVYFAGRWNSDGNDSNSGTNADSPRRTLNNLLSNNRISAGARIRVASGTFNEPEIYPLWSAPVFQGRGSVVIEGQGMDQTHIIRSSGSTGTYGIRLDAARTLTNSVTPLILKNLEIYITADGGAEHTNYVLHNSDSYIRTINCRIGNSSNDDSPLIFLANSGSKYVSENTIHTASSTSSQYKDIVKINAEATIVHLKNSLILNGYNAFTLDFRDVDFSLKNCTLYGIGNNGLTIGAGNNTHPVVKNTIFSCSNFPVEDFSGITETQIDYNLYNRRNNNVTDGGHGPEAGTSPEFVNPLTGDFRLRSNSPGVMEGIMLTDVPFDLTGRLRFDPPCLGAYECSTLRVTPSEITIGSGTGELSGIDIRSNIDWHIADFDNWVNLSSTSGRGTGHVTISSISPNLTALPRNTRLTISGFDTDQTFVEIIQSASPVTSEKDTEYLPMIYYPNPVTNYLKIECGDDEFISLKIINSEGAVLKKEEIRDKLQIVDFSGLESGLYIVELNGKGIKSKRLKIIKL